MCLNPKGTVSESRSVLLKFIDMSTFSIHDFTGKIKTSSLAKTNRFEVVITPPIVLSHYGRDVSLLVENIVLPPLQVGVKPFKIWGPNHQRPISIEYGGDTLPVTFYIDGRMESKKFIDDWVHLVIESGDYSVRYKKDYATTLKIYQLNEVNDPVYTVEVQDAFPRNVSMINLDNSAVSQFLRLNVNFAFRKWVPQTPRVVVSTASDNTN